MRTVLTVGGRARVLDYLGPILETVMKTRKPVGSLCVRWRAFICRSLLARTSQRAAAAADARCVSRPSMPRFKRRSTRPTTATPCSSPRHVPRKPPHRRRSRSCWRRSSDDATTKKLVRETILDGTTKVDRSARSHVRDQVILVEHDAGPDTEIVGFTIRNGDDGIANYATIRIAHNYFTGQRRCDRQRRRRRAVRIQSVREKHRRCASTSTTTPPASSPTTTCSNNDDDGIEIRLHDYRGEPLQVVFRDNIITGNGEDGIQIIDYPEMSDRRIRIERNVIANNAMAGIGLMSDAMTNEDYRGADVPEPIEVVNNTIVGNEYGITGGDNLVAINNVIAGSKQLGMKKVDGQSVASHNLFWANGTDFDETSNVRDEHTLLVDPQLGRELPAAGWQPLRRCRHRAI